MLISIYALGKVVGAEILLAGVLVCALVYLAFCISFRSNRTGRGVKTVLHCLLGAELICDVAWWLIYFPCFEYHNWGIGGVYGAVLWPMLLFVAGVTATGVNHWRGTE